ncbi:MAG: hypothetical protein HYS55_05630 [Candidatus Omnitrophica bacterium]|nr:hypothetical protein [Candidatus Omnitrophota bacterium]
MGQRAELRNWYQYYFDDLLRQDRGDQQAIQKAAADALEKSPDLRSFLQQFQRDGQTGIQILNSMFQRSAAYRRASGRDFVIWTPRQREFAARILAFAYARRARAQRKYAKIGTDTLSKIPPGDKVSVPFLPRAELRDIARSLISGEINQQNIELLLLSPEAAREKLLEQLGENVLAELGGIRRSLTKEVSSEITEALFAKGSQVTIESVQEEVQRAFTENKIPVNIQEFSSPDIISRLEQIAQRVNESRVVLIKIEESTLGFTSGQVTQARGELQVLGTSDRQQVIWAKGIATPEALETASNFATATPFIFVFEFEKQAELAKARSELRMNKGSQFQAVSSGTQLWIFGRGTSSAAIDLNRVPDVRVTKEPLASSEGLVLPAIYRNKASIDEGDFSYLLTAATLLLLKGTVKSGVFQFDDRNELLSFTQALVHVLTLKTQALEAQSRAA